MSSSGLPRWISAAGATGRLVFGIWLLAVLLVLQGASQSRHLSSSLELFADAGALGSMGANERTGSPSLQPRATIGTIPTEARALASWREWSPDGDPPSAVLPALTRPAVPPTLERPWPAAWARPRLEASHAFEARAPPSTG